MAQELDFSSPPNRHSWTDGQRIVLCLLRKYYKNKWDDLARIFNRVFARELSLSGYFQGMPTRVIHSQYHTMQHKKFPVWTKINSSSSLAKREYDLLFLIITTARGLGVTLIRNNQHTPVFIQPSGHSFVEPTEIPVQRLEIFKRQEQEPPADFSTFSPASDGVILEDDRSSSSTTPNSPNSTLRIPQPDSMSPVQNGKPYLAFRYWSSKSCGMNTCSYFVAGIWANQPNHMSQPNFDPLVIESLARSHLTRCKVKTPFISVFDTPLAPLQRALQEDDGMITVFDLSSFDNTRIFSAVDILKHEPLILESHERPYSGYSEFLIWGDISSEHIVGSVRAKDLLDLSSRYEELLQISTIKSFRLNGNPLKRRLIAQKTPANRSTGYLLGRLLCKAKFPQKYASELAIKISKSWRFQMEGDDGFQLLSKGVQAGYDSIRKSSNPNSQWSHKHCSQASSTDDGWEFVEPSDNADWVDEDCSLNPQEQIDVFAKSRNHIANVMGY
ncbi:uncharacterized protein CIMG_08047 [Coccidioides immitis RS]|uniref:DUF7587 domain-containing protein n=2 Tax=Coccidioides immitis TaxID=5501 RepID=A0A0E1RVX5_COCIM|nr:uncharacterized protein CIMG_08047 [Coccidioides immitis RS]EAS29301.1 hypothetical protein CIMG_08047 [Coccidioides immitis RS]KMU80360.1 hypothetical protein CISG_02211 [Coccidioides immitis RMSCC 3703]